MKRTWGAATVLALLLAAPAWATPLIDFGVEGSAAAPLGSTAVPFGWGGAVAGRGQVRVMGPLALQLGVGFASLASRYADAPAPGNALWGGGGARLVLLEGPRESLWSHLWVDAQLDAVGTGSLVRFGYELGVGAQLRLFGPLGVGPAVRFLHIVDAPGPTRADAFVLSLGLSVSLGSFPNAKPPPSAVTVHDADGDGIPDELDKCPQEPETFNNYQDDDGCPDTAPAETVTVIEKKRVARTNRDGDGIFDDADQCPDEAEVFNGVEDDDGCPDKPEALVALKGDRLELKQPVKYEFVRGGVQVSKQSRPMLSAAATVLSLHPEFRAVRILVRADKQASRDVTGAVGQKQAAAVRLALIELGLDAGRLVAAGLGDGPARVELVLER